MTKHKWLIGACGVSAFPFGSTASEVEIYHIIADANSWEAQSEHEMPSIYWLEGRCYD